MPLLAEQEQRRRQRLDLVAEAAMIAMNVRETAQGVVMDLEARIMAFTWWSLC